MQFQLLYFTFICYQLILIIELVPKMKYLCFDLMFLSEINQVILVAILLFLDLGSVLRVFFFVTFYFLQFFFDRTILVQDGCYFQTSKIKTKSIRIIWQKVDVSVTFCEFSEKSLHFHFLPAKNNQFFSVTVNRLLPSLKYPVNENFILRKISQ